MILRSCFMSAANASILNSPSLSIVGTRRPTVYGTQMAERMGRDLAKRGLAIARPKHSDGAPPDGSGALVSDGIDAPRQAADANCPPALIPPRRTSRSGTALSPACPWEWSSWRANSSAAP